MAEFSNPNQQGGQDNKSLVAMMVVFVAVLFGAQYYHSKMNPAAGPDLAPAHRCLQPPRAGRGCDRRDSGTAVPRAAAAKSAAPAVPVVQASAETTTVIENELYRITFSNRGAQVT